MKVEKYSSSGGRDTKPEILKVRWKGWKMEWIEILKFRWKR